jgi:hypothetical protein
MNHCKGNRIVFASLEVVNSIDVENVFVDLKNIYNHVKLK